METDKLSKVKNFALTLMPVWIFLFFLSVFLIIQFSGPQVPSSDDPSYHIAHSLSYLKGETWSYPVFSTLSTRPVDLYFLYHVLLSRFLVYFDGSNYEALVAGLKIFHSLLVALFFSVYYFALTRILASENQSLKKFKVFFYSLIGSLFLFFASGVFTFRLYFPRPHIVSVILVFIGFYLLLKRKYVWLFVVAFLLPFFYSFPFVILIPSFIYVVSTLIYDGTFKRFSSYVPFIIPVAGLSAGIFSRPDSFNYLYNGSFAVLFSIYNSYFGGVPEGAELAPPVWNIHNFVLIFLFVVVCFVYFALIRERGLRRSISFNKFYLLVLSMVLFIPMVLMERVAEYAVPFLVLSVVWIISDEGMRIFSKVVGGELENKSLNVVTAELLRAGRAVLTTLINPGNWFRRIFYFIFSLFFVFSAINLVLYLKHQPSLGEYQGATKFLKENSQEGDIVFQQRFDIYPRLVFYNSRNRYVAGFAGTFTYLFDKELFWLWNHIVGGVSVCPRRRCLDEESLDVYTVIKETFKAKYVFIDASREMSGVAINNNQEFIDLMEKDQRFRKVYTDPKYPEIMVFGL